jgi:5'(3')-deoxyribonucleotidase
MSTRPRALLDCDGVVGDFITPCLREIALLTGADHAHDDVDVWDFDVKLISSEELRREYWSRITAPGFCASIEPYPHAKEGVKLLQSYADVYIVTAPMLAPTWASERQQWLAEHFGISHKRIVSTPAKYLVRGELLVDDKPEHVEQWQAANPCGVGVLWSRAYNRHATHLRSVSQWGPLVDLMQRATRGAA